MKDILMRATSSSPCYLILTLVFLLFLKIDASTCSSNDLRALQDFSQSLDIKILKWPLSNANSSSCCSWPGVQCDLVSGLPSSSINSSVARVVGLNLSGKGLEGVLPSSISGLDKLSYLNLSSNSFLGRIPQELFQLKNLEVLDLRNNQFSGELLPGIRNLSNLHHLDLSNNLFTGSIPDVFQGLQKLEVFSAESNELVGGLPASLSSCSELTMLSLWNNSLDGSLENLNWSRLVHLSTLNLGWNSLEWHIPEAFSACKELKILSLSRNKIQGQIPKTFSNLRSLNYLDLSTNNHSNISESLKVLQKCHNLTVLILAQNFVGEELPINGIQGFPKVWDLYLGNSGLTGSLPLWLRNCTNLRALTLASNYLTGEIPSWFGGFDHLFLLNLSNNSLSGEIPVSLSQLKSFTSGVTSEDRYVSCCLSMVIYWKEDGISAGRYRYYKFYNNVPVLLDLSSNKLDGSIRKEFGNLKHLQVLDLRMNCLSGSIPEELSGMSYLEKLDLSFNNLSGIIPSSLTKLNFLSFFSVAHNQLEGRIPSAGQFFSFPCSNFEGNLGLYDTLDPCNSTLNTTYPTEGDDDEEDESDIWGRPFRIGGVVGFLCTVYLFMCCWGRNYEYY